MSKGTILAIAALVMALFIGGVMQANQPDVDLGGMRVAVLVADGYDYRETTEPAKSLKDLGAAISMISPQQGQVISSEMHTLSVDKTITEVSVDDFDALIIPGGDTANLEASEAALAYVRDFYATGKPVASICHGPVVLSLAGVVEGKQITGAFDTRDIYTSNGATYVTEPTVRDGNLLTSMHLMYIPQFTDLIKNVLYELKTGTNN